MLTNLFYPLSKPDSPSNVLLSDKEHLLTDSGNGTKPGNDHDPICDNIIRYKDSDNLRFSGTLFLFSF